MIDMFDDSKENELFWLEVKSPDDEKFIISLKDIDCFTIGRDEANDLSLDDPHKIISREHCRIEIVSGLKMPVTACISYFFV